jgi:methionyl-tRNA synthetase
MKQKIDFAEFLEIASKLEIKAGLIESVVEVPKSTKLLQMQVNFGDGDIRTVVTNIKSKLEDWTQLKGITSYFVTNLKPAKMMGIESQASIAPQLIGDKLAFGLPVVGAELI